MPGTWKHIFHIQMKRCSKCKLPKPIDQFYPRYDGSGKLRPQCKECNHRNGTTYKRNNEAARMRYLETTWRSRLVKRFGITFEQYSALYEAQGGACALCQQPESSPRNKNSVKLGPRRLAVDHDHTTGKVRGLLCSDCNRGIGLLNDDPALMHKAAFYLEGLLNISVDKPLESPIMRSCLVK